MRLTFEIDTQQDARKDAIGAILAISRVYDLRVTVDATQRISHADNPETGIVAIPSVIPVGGEKSISQLAQELAARGLPPAPTLEMPNPAAVFGGAAVPLPPVPPAPNAAPPVPLPPPSTPGPASPVPLVPPASSPSTAGTPPALPAAPGASVELDSTGLPWDQRIHGSTRSKNANGTWRAKRGINDPALVKRVETELRAVMALPQAAATVPVAPQAAATVPVAPPVPPAPPAGEAPPTAPPAAVAFGAVGMAAPTTFPELMVALTPAMTQNRLGSALLIEACQSVGVPGIALLATRPDLVPQVFEYLRARVQL